MAILAVLLLLLFKMTVPLAERSPRVDVPQANQVSPISVQATRTLSIGGNGAWTLDGRAIDPGDSAAVLADLASYSPQPVLRIRGARNLTYSQIKDTIEKARAAGIRDIRLEVATSEYPGQSDEPTTGDNL